MRIGDGQRQARAASWAKSQSRQGRNGSGGRQDKREVTKKNCGRELA